MRLRSYHVHGDALLARIVYRWRLRSIGAALVLLTLLLIATGAIAPFWRGRAQLTIIAAPGASVQVDRHSWPRSLYAGAHTVVATMPDGRRAWADIELRSGLPITLTLPTGLPQPREQLLAAPAPGLQIEQVWWADGAWRVTGAPKPADHATDERHDPIATPVARQTVAVRAEATERLTTLDAYAGLADQVHVRGHAVEAIYAPPGDQLHYQTGGRIEVRGWSALTQSTAISAPLTLLRFSPDGTALLEAERVPSGGEQVYLVTQDMRRTPVVAVPGEIVRVGWRPDSQALLLHSVQADRLLLTLLRRTPSLSVAVLAEMPAERFADALVPLTWDDTGVVWVAPDSDGRAMLWRASLTRQLPERVGQLDARVLAHLPDGALRIVTIQDGQVVIGQYHGAAFIGEAILPYIPAAADLAGEWQGNELLLVSNGRVWLLNMAKGATSDG